MIILNNDPLIDRSRSIPPREYDGYDSAIVERKEEKSRVRPRLTFSRHWRNDKAHWARQEAWPHVMSHRVMSRRVALHRVFALTAVLFDNWNQDDPEEAAIKRINLSRDPREIFFKAHRSNQLD